MTNIRKNRIQSRFALNAIMLCSGMAALFPIAYASAEEINKKEEQIEKITVTGIMGSIQKSLNTKRFSDQIKDAISAEDIGKLPDQNIAEALQRITGVQIGREFGEGNEVAVRGMSQNRVEINGQTTMGSNSESRGIQFNDLAPDAFSSMEVIKTPTADMTEGALGATINLITRRGFDSDHMILSSRLKSEYSELSGEYSPNFSGFFSNNWDTDLGAMGMAFSVNYSKSTKRRDTSETRWKKAPGNLVEEIGDQVAALGGNFADIIDENGVVVPGVYVLDRINHESYVREQERIGGTVNFQWAPTDALEVYIDANYNQFDIPTAVQQNRVQAGARGGDYGVVTVHELSASNTVMSASWDRVKNWNSSWNQASERKTYGATLGFNYNYQDNWDFSGTIGKSYGENEKGFSASGANLFDDKGTQGIGFKYAVGQNDLPDYGMYYNVNGNAIPLDLTNRSLFKNGNVSGISANRTSLSNENTEVKFDVDYFVDAGHFTSVEFGVRYADRQADRTKLKLPRQPKVAGGLDENPGIETYSPPSDLLSGLSGGLNGGNTAFITTNTGDFFNNIAFFENLYGFNIDTMADDHTSTFVVNEKTSAAYVKANFEGELIGTMPYSANLGVRYVSTDLFSEGWQGETLADKSVTWTWVDESNKYSDPLVSGNIQFALTDQMIFRLAGAQVMARAKISQLSKGLTLGFPDNATGERKGRGGNPQLDPYRATQYDASWEWYGENNDFVSAAVFYKDIEAYIINQTDYQDIFIDGAVESVKITAPINGEGGAIVQGIEVAATKTFGFLGDAFKSAGVSANFTYADSETANVNQNTGELLPLEDLSETSYNLVAFYEKNRFSTRLAYNWRSKFLDKTFDQNFEPVYTKARGQLDWSLSYPLTKKIKVSFNGINLTDTRQEQYIGIEERQGRISLSGRRYSLGLSGRF